MKLTDAPSRIVGVQLGEATLNFLQTGATPIRAKFALLGKEGDATGFVDITGPWSDKTLDALRTFMEVLEEEAVQRLFDGPAQAAETSQGEARPEPPQF